ncbi:MAG: hypothetical protein HY584_06520 [Candidatus Omnitrophica bacterium]|nr:hypothetical protein [Candidatus Omnitrophota bacterium]
MNPFVLFMLLLLLSGCGSVREKYIKTHPDLLPEHAATIRQRAVMHDFTKDSVRASLGAPQKTYGYQRNEKLVEFWVYSDYEWREFENVLFDDGKVVGWNLPKRIKRKLDERSVDELLQYAEGGE